MAGYTPAPRPTGQRLRSPGTCFATTLRVLAHPDFVYVGGYALSASPCIMAIHHAWAATADGGVVDLVWKEPTDNTNLGVPFTAHQVSEAITATHKDDVLLCHGLEGSTDAPVPWRRPEDPSAASR